MGNTYYEKIDGEGRKSEKMMCQLAWECFMSLSLGILYCLLLRFLASFFLMNTHSYSHTSLALVTLLSARKARSLVASCA